MTTPYEQAASAIRANDGETLRGLLAHHPALVQEEAAPNRTTLLHEAACGDHVGLVRTLISAGANVDGPEDSNGSTPLHFAASLGRNATCAALIAAGADVEAEADSQAGGTPLMYALVYGHAGTADLLARHSLAPGNLRVAAGLGRVDLLRELVDEDDALADAAFKGREWYRPHDEMPPCTITDDPQDLLDEALWYASINGRVGAARWLIARGARSDGRPWWCTPLQAAVWGQHIDVLEVLIEQDQDFLVRDTSYDATVAEWTGYVGNDVTRQIVLSATAKHDPWAALQLDRLDLLDKHLTAGADPSELLLQATVSENPAAAAMCRKYGGRLTVDSAVRVGDAETVRHWINNDGSPDHEIDVELSIPGKGAMKVRQRLVNAAATARFREICAVLREAGAQVDLHAAAALGMVDRMAELLGPPADAAESSDGPDPVDMRDALGRTPLHCAIMGHAAEAVDWLLDRGARVDVSADAYSHGPRALHVAAEVNAPATILESLLQYGANINAAWNPGTPLDCALRVGASDAAQWLRAHGASVEREL